MKCNACGNTIPDESVFCPFCGNKLEAVQCQVFFEPTSSEGSNSNQIEARIKKKNKNKESKVILLIIIAAAIVLSATFGYTLYQKNQRYEYGISCYRDGEYEVAKGIFEECLGYKRAEDYYYLCKANISINGYEKYDISDETLSSLAVKYLYFSDSAVVLEKLENALNLENGQIVYHKYKEYSQAFSE